MNKKLKSLERTCDARLEVANEEMIKQEKKLNNAHQKEKAELFNAHQKQIELLKSVHDADHESYKEKFKKAVSALTKKHADQVRILYFVSISVDGRCSKKL